MGNGEWLDFESLDYQGIGQPLYVWWGDGPDEHSPNAWQIGDGDSVRRCTWTSPVVGKDLLDA